MLIRIRNLKDKRDGQAIVLAALGMLILAIGVLATVNLGHAIHERIKLQNNADATAYSLAALEARAFNFFSFVNRAQVSHYISAMSFQSLLAVIWFIDSLAGTLGDLCTWIYAAAIAACVFAVGCAFIKPARMAYKALYKFEKFWKKTVANPADRFIGPVLIPACYLFNKIGMFGAQKLMKHLVQINVADSMYSITKKNDPELERNLGSLGTLALNSMEYSRAFDKNAEKLRKSNMWSGDTKMNNARRVMTETSNATRWGIFITNRSFGGAISTLLPGAGKVFDVLMKILPITILPTGQTKMITHRRKKRCKHRFGAGANAFSTGNLLVADEVLVVSVGIWKWRKEFGVNDDIVSVWAGDRGHSRNYGEHCAWDHKGVKVPVIGSFYIPIPKCFRDKKNHPWEGVEPYIKFNPNSGNKSFHQPSTYSFLNKNPEKLGGQQYVQKFDFTIGGRTESLDTNIGIDPLVNVKGLTGLNAWSRAMAYYHRPSFKSGGSNWKEHPNFFNPFWRPKLAPLGEKLSSILNAVGIRGRLATLISSELITH